ncbi:serine/threonine-protein kinase Nek1-like [Ylistrum balloti]|uniref:serine/threonine-protein kinase Nek1-like n=1 Tax=Ylistrum balloti TaxID=509963 RepID=UPI002905937F|nr:serine/threonine-protein kinase Nek1-like [Ylistrum balloti]
MDKYVKVRQIGEGAFGKAVLVRQKQNNKQMVIKEINIAKMNSKEREEARKEVAVLAQLHHPNIVAYRESFEERGLLYIVMDFCEKGDLYSKINSQRGLLIPEDQVLDMFVQMCLAIKHIHDRKILHRDIKSQNIFITADGRIKLGDFGIAKVLNSTVELARTCIGTPYYLSPEICENRPYNNKSDIWSLGCVLYEMTTLKHAYEAGNMKNLVLKIIRGSYPPIPPKYSYDLRGLIAKLFKRTPRDRPSINSILKTNFIMKRVTKFLSEDELQDEFSHTVMHGKKLARKLPPPPPSSRPPSAAGVRKAVGQTPAARYNPASVYGAPVGGPRKSKENRGSVDVKKRPGSAGSAGRPGSAGGRPGSASQDLKKKKEDLILKEKKRRMEENKAAAEKKHKELLEKQKMARINKAREDNWKNMINSLDSDEGAKKVNCDKHDAREPPRQSRPLPDPPQNIAQKDRGNYERYHAYLDKIQKNRDAQLNNIRPVQPAAAYMVAPRPLPGGPKQSVPHWQRPSSGRTPEPTPICPDPRAGGDRPKTPAEERARIVDEFVMRKREAALNRQRGNADLFGNAAPAAAPAAAPPYAVQRPRQPPTPARHEPSDGALDSARDKEEKEYLEKLKQIRMQNFQDRRQIQNKPQDAKAEAEARRKKVEALRQQADDRAKQLKEQLERQRKDKYDQARQKASRPVPAPRPVINPAPAVAMTAALKAVGVEPKELPKPVQTPAVGMTGALKAIGVVNDEPPPVDSKSPLKQQKEEILRRLNEKVTPRGKWGAPAEIAVEEEVQNPPESSRSRWKEGPSDQVSIKEMPLEQTASQMEATSIQDKVIQHPAAEADVAADVAAAVSRQQWGRPGSTVLNALKEIPIKEGTMDSNKSDDSVPSSTEGDSTPAKGSTITLTPKPVINKGTITIGAADEAKQSKEKFLKRPDISQPISEESNVSQNKDSNSTPARVEVSSSAKPPLPNKPDLHSKFVATPKPQQDILPTPVILAKPDTPMNFGQTDQIPKAVDLSSEGKLFEKAEEKSGAKEVPKQENLEAKGQSNLSPSEKRSSGVILGLTSGQFDIGNAHMLRTCSEPDLAKLFKTLEQSSQNTDNPQRVSLDLEKQREQVDPQVGLLDNVELDLEEEDINIVDDDEYEELLSVRETMQSLLIREYSTDEESQHSTSHLSVASNIEDKIDEEEDMAEVKEDDKEAAHVSDDSDNEDAEEDREQEDDNDVENQEENAEEEENTEEVEDQDDEELLDDKSDLFQSDESDADTQFGDDDDDFDLFSRLEESRAELENQLGCDRFLKVYKTVQALQEDEDENMEDGVAIVTKMLGKDKEHLYPKIFQLVMADSAFTEDN